MLLIQWQTTAKVLPRRRKTYRRSLKESSTSKPHAQGSWPNSQEYRERLVQSCQRWRWPEGMVASLVPCWRGHRSSWEHGRTAGSCRR